VAGVKLGPGTLYGALSRLEGRDLIEPLPSEDRRRPYKITAAGSAALTEQLQMLDRVVETGMKRLRAAEAAS
jgi:DNA-binding PadR family transcriptional regulator